MTQTTDRYYADRTFLYCVGASVLTFILGITAMILGKAEFAVVATAVISPLGLFAGKRVTEEIKKPALLKALKE